MDGFDAISTMLSDLNLDPRIAAAVIAIVSLLKRTIHSLHDRTAEITTFVTSQILAWGQWVAEFMPIVSTVGLNFLSGVAIWLMAKAGYKSFQKFLTDNQFSEAEAEREREQERKESSNAATRSTDDGGSRGTHASPAKLTPIKRSRSDPEAY